MMSASSKLISDASQARSQGREEEKLLEVRGIYAGYGKFDVLRGVSLHVKPGEIVSIIGPNGAGKSTLFKTITGFLKPREGQVFFAGQEITGVRPDLLGRKGLSYIPQGRSLFPEMTVKENLELGAFIERDRRKVSQALEEVYARYPRLWERRGQLAGNLSGGEQQMLVMGRALMLRPKLVLLDEPSLGLAPKLVTLIFEQIQQLNDWRMTLILIEQNARRALEAAHRGYVLDLGQNRFQGTGLELLNDPQVKQLYLGG